MRQVCGTVAFAVAFISCLLTATSAGGEMPKAPQIAWGQISNGLEVGLVPIGSAWGMWLQPFQCPGCIRTDPRRDGGAKCVGCGPQDLPLFKAGICPSCAAASRVCEICGKGKPAGNEFNERGSLAFELHFRNAGDAPITLFAPESAAHWTFAFKPGTDSDVARRSSQAAGPAPTVLHGGAVLPKGRHGAVLLWADPGHWKFEDDRRDEPLRRAAADRLAAGPYTVVATYEHAAGHEGAGKCPCWHGKASSGEATINIIGDGKASFYLVGPREVTDEAAVRRALQARDAATGRRTRFIRIEDSGTQWEVYHSEFTVSYVSKKTGWISQPISLGPL